MSETQSLFIAIKSGDMSRVRRLVQAEPALAAAVGEDGVSAVLLAVYYGQREIVDELLGQDIELNLWEACAVGREARVAEILSQNPALVNVFSQDGFLPLGLAVFFGYPAVVEGLLARGAEVNLPSQNAMRVCPLHSAVAQSNPALALALTRRLLEKGADPNVRQAGGWTPLHGAARRGHLEMVAVLLGAGADAATRNDEGVTALDLAQAEGHAEVVRLLERN